MSAVTWDAILVTVDGFGFGTLGRVVPEKCALSHGSGVLGRHPRDSCRFWSPHVEKVCTVTPIRLGEGSGGGGGDIIGGGGSANREPGSYICIDSIDAKHWISWGGAAGSGAKALPCHKSN